MTPRPTEPPRSHFEEPLRLALQGRFTEAIERIAPVLSTPGHDAGVAVDALAQVARMADSAGDPGSAEHALGLALEARPRHADLHFQRACVLLRLKRRADARQSLDRALAINPRYAAARLERALLDAREGRLGEALESLRALSRECAIAEESAFQQGMQRLERAAWEEAQTLFQRALRLSNPALQQQLQRFHALVEQGEVPGAMQVLREAIKEHPLYPDLHALLGRAELRQGHCDDAVASFGRALEINPDYHDARVDLARALEALGMRIQAADQLALVIEREPEHPQALELHARWSARPRAMAERENPASKPS